MRRHLENSLDEGTTSRLTLFFSQLNLDAGEVIESTFTSSMAQSHKQEGGKLGRPEKQYIGKKITRRLNEVSRQNGKRERARGREIKREGNTKYNFTEKTQVSRGERRFHKED